jgi:hypothetical protein
MQANFDSRPTKVPLEGSAGTCFLHNLDRWLIKRKKIKGWVGKPEGLLEVLWWETKWINLELPVSK